MRQGVKKSLMQSQIGTTRTAVVNGVQQIIGEKQDYSTTFNEMQSIDINQIDKFIYGETEDVLSQKASLNKDEKIKANYQRKRQNSQNLESEFRQLNKYLNWNILSLNE